MNGNYEIYPIKFSDIRKSIVKRGYSHHFEKKMFEFLINILEQTSLTNGIIAGGFVEYLVRYHNQISEFTANDILTYLADSDVDIFFNSEHKKIMTENLIELSLRYQNISYNKKDSICKNASNFLINNHLKFQFVGCVYGNVEQILNSFDITNCKVAIFDDQIIIHKDFLKYSKNFKVNLDNINSVFYINRLRKYIGSKSYELITQNTIDLISKNYITTFLELEKNSNINGYIYTSEALMNHLSMLRKLVYKQNLRKKCLDELYIRRNELTQEQLKSILNAFDVPKYERVMNYDSFSNDQIDISKSITDVLSSTSYTYNTY